MVQYNYNKDKGVAFMYLISYRIQGCTMFLSHRFDTKEKALKVKREMKAVYPECEWHIHKI